MRAARRAVVAFAAALALSVPTAAQAGRSWQQDQSLAAGVDPNVDKNDPRGVAIDASGNALFGVSGYPKYRWVARPHGGPPGVAQTFPTGTSLGTSPAMFGMDGSGNALAFDGGSTAFRPAGAASVFGTEHQTAGRSMVDIAVAPTGEALGLFGFGGDHLEVAFRPAGAGATFDMAGATALPPAAGDDRVRGVGIAIDPDGGAVAVYWSSTSSNQTAPTLLQAVRPANGSFQPPTTIASWPSSAGAVFDDADDGTAVVMGRIPYSTVVASVRAPGGSFGPEQVLRSLSPGEASTPVVAAARGGAVVAWTHTVPYNLCPGGAGGEYGWEASAYFNGAWHDAGGGPATWNNGSAVESIDGAGPTIALLVRESTDTGGNRCTAVGRTATLKAFVGTPSALGPGTAVANSIANQANQNAPTVPIAGFIGAGSGGDALVSYRLNGGTASDNFSHIVAYEDPSVVAGGGPPGGGGPTGGGGSTGGGGGGSTSGGGGSQGGGGGGSTPARPTAPAKVTLKGPVVVKNGIAPIPFQCTSEIPCGFVVQIFGIKGGAQKAAKAKALGKGSGTIRAGKNGTVKVKLTSAARNQLAKAKKHKLKVQLKVVITVDKKKTTLTSTATLKG